MKATDFRDKMQQWVVENDDLLNGPEPASYIGLILARVAHRILLDAGVPPKTISLENRKSISGIICEIAEDYSLADDENIGEVVFLKWDDVRLPWGVNVLETAQEAAQDDFSYAPGVYANDKQHQVASFLWHVMRNLPKAEDGTVFLSVRSAAKMLGCRDLMSINRAVKALVLNGVIAVKLKGSGMKASRYLILQ